MRIKELRAKAREDSIGNKWALVMPMFCMMAVIYFIGLIPELITNETAKGILGIIAFILTMIFAIPMSYAYLIRTVRVARKEEKGSFVSDIFGEGMRNGWSCAWGIFKKIWPWVVVLFVGYILLFVGATFVTESGYSTFTTDMANIAVSDVVGYSIGGLISMLVGFILVVVSAIKTTLASYKYFIVTYLKHDYPDKTTSELLSKSEEMMDGNKAKAFVMPITFFGWFILAAICATLVGVLFYIIWPPKVYAFGITVSSTPLWATILLALIEYFIISFVGAYLQMTACEFYLERNPLEIYNEGYVKPETNPSKYKKIIGWIIAIIVIVYVAIIAIGGFLYTQTNRVIEGNFDTINQMLQDSMK